MKEFEKNYEANRYGYELKNYYVKWEGLNKKCFTRLKDACRFADTINEKEPEIYKVERIVI